MFRSSVFIVFSNMIHYMCFFFPITTRILCNYLHHVCELRQITFKSIIMKLFLTLCRNNTQCKVFRILFSCPITKCKFFKVNTKLHHFVPILFEFEMLINFLQFLMLYLHLVEKSTLQTSNKTHPNTLMCPVFSFFLISYSELLIIMIATKLFYCIWEGLVNVFLIFIHFTSICNKELNSITNIGSNSFAEIINGFLSALLCFSRS